MIRRAMRRAVRRAVLAGVSVVAAGLAVPVGAAPATAETDPGPPAAPVTVTGTYTRLAKDHLDPDGELAHEYEDVLRVRGRAIPLRLPRDHGVKPGSTVQVSALSSGGTLDVTSVRRLSPAVAPPAGTVSVLMILAYWTKPDSVTQSRATAQVFGDAHNWFKEVSYGKAGLTGVVTPWVRIKPPSTGRCYADAEEILASARAKAAALGGKYAPYQYQRTIVYFPRCAGGDTTGVAGWAYEPGDVAWLNGYLDRRTTVHEQGHNYGMGHARSLACTSGGTRVTFSGSCTSAVYGDPYDAMGRSSYAAHFSGYRKDVAGWLGARKRVLTTSSSTFTLPPFEKPSSLPLVVVAQSNRVEGRAYWLEYRRPVGMDARLPAGATGGVLVHLQDSGRSGWLLDGSPGDATFSTAVIKPGRSWTSPDYVKISVGTISSTGARVTVTGARPAPTVPTAPRYVAATPLDGGAEITWSPPASTGRAPISEYVAVATSPTGARQQLSLTATTFKVRMGGLTNGATYTVQVRARNEVGFSPAGSATVQPHVMPPTVRLVSPAPGAQVKGPLTFIAEATPHPVSDSGINCVRFYVDDQQRGQSCSPNSEGDFAATWHSDGVANGPHKVRAVAVDYAGREGAAGPVDVTMTNPVPEVAWVSPAPDAVIDADTVTLEVSASVPLDPSVGIRDVVFYDTTRGWDSTIGSLGYHWTSQSIQPPYRIQWPVAQVSGKRDLVARVTATNGKSVRVPLSVTINHPPATIAVTAPAAGETLTGTAVTVTADAAVTAAGSSVDRVTFSVNGYHLGEDRTAPYEVPWDISAITGRQEIVARVYETSGRYYWSAPVVVQVGNVLPVLAITAPAYYARVGPIVHQLRGTARAGTGGEAPDRVVLTMDRTVLATVTPAADGTWSYAWDATKKFGSHFLEAKAYTPSGLVANQHVWFSVVHPYPVMTVESPAWSGVLRGGAVNEFVIAAKPGAEDPETVAGVCVRIYWYSLPTCTGPSADGKFRVPVDVQERSGSYNTTVMVKMSDGHVHYLNGPHVYVARPPAAPAVAVQPARGSLTVSITPPPYSEPVPLTGYVVTVGEHTREVTAGPVTVDGLADGVTYDVTVRAVNAVGAGAAAAATGHPGAPSRLVATTTPPARLTTGSTVTFAGRLTGEADAPLAGQRVALDVCTGTTCAEAAAGVTDADGAVSLSAAPEQGTSLRLRYDGDAVYADAAVSAPVQVLPKVTMTLSAASIPYSGQVTIGSSVSPARAGTLYVEYRSGYYWYGGFLGPPGADGTLTSNVGGWYFGQGSHSVRLRFRDQLTGEDVYSNELPLSVTY